jgi:hypothetical protein
METQKAGRSVERFDITNFAIAGMLPAGATLRQFFHPDLKLAA